MALKIEDYAVIGDCKTAALIGRNGSIDWLCWPRFDSAACFAALLGECENGRWLIAPKEEPIEVSRRYCSGSLVLETEFRTQTGSATLGFPLVRSARFDGLSIHGRFGTIA
jgi:GH15 family glucan-1,4-alpha-glucosidase